MHLLITTQVHDVHAEAVAAGLRGKGHEVTLHYGCDFPEQQWHSLRMGAGQQTLESRDKDGDLPFSRADVVWNRRFEQPVASDALHPGDRVFARREAQHIARGVLHSATTGALWINPAPAATRAQLKPYQLTIAAELGFAIPDTMIGNDPRQIREFVREVGHAIYKPCLSTGWRNDERYVTLYTTPVTLAELQDDQALQLCPGIYQRSVEKAYEVRVTVMGRSCFGLQLDPHAHSKGANDWRRAQHLGLNGRVIALPQQLEERVHALMARLGLVFGCLDFIVTPEGDWVFLEINEMGQFLWGEQMVPELTLLDAFVQFVESADPAFVYLPAADPVRLSPLLESGELERRLMQAAAGRRKPTQWFEHNESEPSIAA